MTPSIQTLVVDGGENLNQQVLILFQITQRKNRNEQFLQVLQKENEEGPQFHGENKEEEATPEEACDGSKLCPWASFPLCNSGETNYVYQQRWW